jgi:hypothetical protein
VTLDGGIHDSYLWSDYSASPTLTVSLPGNYSLLVTDDGCQISDEVLVSIAPEPLSAFSYNVNELEVSFINRSSDADSYYWTFGDKLTDTIPDPIHLYPVSGVYTVSLLASSLTCGASTFTDTITLVTTSIEDVGSDISFTVYPNPSHGIFNLDINNPKSSELKISIYNSAGQIVYDTKLNSVKSSEQINMNNMASGIYSIRLVSKDVTKTAKLILTD